MSVLGWYFGSMPPLPALVLTHLPSGREIYQYPPNMPLVAPSILSWLQRIEDGSEPPAGRKTNKIWQSVSVCFTAFTILTIIKHNDPGWFTCRCYSNPAWPWGNLQRCWPYHDIYPSTICAVYSKDCQDAASIQEGIHRKRRERNAFSSSLSVTSHLGQYRRLLRHENEIYGATFGRERISCCCLWLQPSPTCLCMLQRSVRSNWWWNSPQDHAGASVLWALMQLGLNQPRVERYKKKSQRESDGCWGSGGL